MEKLLTTKLQIPPTRPEIVPRPRLIECLNESITSFLNQVMGMAWSADDVAVLESWTDGWIAGLNLAPLTIREKDDVAKFITEFAGDDRYIVDSLVDEELAQRLRGTKDFLLKTPILHCMTGSLCDTVTGQEGGQEQLERLDQANLFIVPLDNQRRWYRYHHLLADLLQQRLQQNATSSAEDEGMDVSGLNIRARARQWIDDRLEHNAHPHAKYLQHAGVNNRRVAVRKAEELSLR